MQNQILKSPNDYCYLVEVIAPTSRNIPWGCSVGGSHVESEHIRRVSIDQLYKLVIGIVCSVSCIIMFHKLNHRIID